MNEQMAGRHLLFTRRRAIVAALAGGTWLGALGLVAPAHADSTTACTPTGYVRDSINLTAALVNPGKVAGPVDATGCNIGVYYGPGASGTVSHAEIFGANYFGVVNRGAQVTVEKSSVHDIGESPLNGTQHGVGIYWVYDSGATGVINNNQVSRYQKGGIVVNGGSDSAEIQNNTVTGLGRVDFIAGNGIQLGFGAHGEIAGNRVVDNAYTGENNAYSAGILVFGGYGDPLVTHVDIHNNVVTNNDVGIYLTNYADDGSVPSTPTDDAIHNNLVTNDAVTNISGDGYPMGYQAGIVDVGNGDQIHNNTISGLGYTSTSSAAVVMPIDTTFTNNVKLHKNKVSNK